MTHTKGDRHVNIHNDQTLHPVRILSDERLSFRARGIVAVMFFADSNGLDSISRIASKGKEGVAAVSAALKELESFGYLIRQQYNDEAGRLRHSYTLTDPGQGRDE
jgi:hypothetical protein